MNNMIKVIIVEDEASSAESLKRILREHAHDVQVIAETESVAEAITLILSLKPDLVFLDIHLTDGLGFDVISRCSYRDYRVIFLTAHDNYAVTAFRYNAIDYLLKPVDTQQVLEALDKARQNPIVSSHFEERFMELAGGMRGNERKRIALPSFEGLTMVNITDIVHCSSDGNYTTFYTIKGKKILVSRSIKEYDELLSPFNFFRVHQSHLVNLAYVEQFLKEDGGTLVMADGSRIDVSRRRKDLLLEALMRFGI